MKSYLEGCTVPTTQIGQAEIPRLIMGIHPYDGCSYQNKQRDEKNFRAFSRVEPVADVLRCAIEEGGITAVQVDHMLPKLDRLHLQAIWGAEQQTDTQIGMVAYILIPITEYPDTPLHQFIFIGNVLVQGLFGDAQLAGHIVHCHAFNAEAHENMSALF